MDFAYLYPVIPITVEAWSNYGNLIIYHIDITSFHVNGKYAQDPDYDTTCISLVRGYSRDYHPDLNQVVLEFSCGADALQAVIDFEKQCEFIRIDNPLAVAVSQHKGPGRPKINKAPEKVNYHVRGLAYTSLSSAAYANRKIGIFTLTTNEMNNKKLDMKGILAHYKSQQSVERGFRFLKSPEFLTSAIFLKNPKRIEALLMIMTCCLMVYAALEHKIRKSLKTVPAFFPSMKNKSTIKPTARWVFLKYSAIHLHHWHGETRVVGLKPYQVDLLKLLGKHYEKVYS